MAIATDINPVMDEVQLVYLYDGSLEGLFTSIFEAFRRKQEPVNIVQDGLIQQSLLHSYIPIETQQDLAERVRDGILNKLGNDSYTRIKRVFLSADPIKGGALLRYLMITMRKGSRSCFYLANPAVVAFEELHKQVANEAHHFLQFVRFAQLNNGVYYSRIEPQASVVPLIMDHFASRFNVQPFIIYDKVHDMAGVFDTERWWLVDANDIQLPTKSHAEDEFQSLWQTFYDTIAIEERKNPTCQRNFMPKRFWGNMCEHIPAQLRNVRPKTETPTAVAKRSSYNLPEAKTRHSLTDGGQM
jgi:probable DNA metabolism protein